MCKSFLLFIFLFLDPFNGIFKDRLSVFLNYKKTHH